MTEWGLVVAAFGGLPLVALGLWVHVQPGRNRARRWFTVFAVSMGLRPVGTYALVIDPALSVAGTWFAAAMLVVQIVAVVAFTFAYASARDRSPVARSVAAIAALLPSLAYFLLALADGTLPTRPESLVQAIAFRVAGSVFLVPLVAFPLLARFVDHPDRLALLCLALAIYPGYLAWAGGGAESTLAQTLLEGDLALSAYTLLLLGGLVAGAALWITASAGGSPMARATGWAYLWMPLLSGIYLLVGGDARAGYGISRLLTVAVMAYALLRHQLLGIDVKLRFAISKSTMAAIFIAVFFIGSEAAQQFFGDQFESGYLGILAAGALVFAIAPLSRVADRLAEKAVPRTAATTPVADLEREEMYRSAVRLALRDRRLTRSEERELFHLARGLGLEAERAHEILVETESLEGKTQ